MLAGFAPKRVAGAGFVVAGEVVLPKRLAVLVLELVLAGVVMFAAGVGSVELLLPNKLVVAGAVVAVVAAGGFIVVGFAVSAGFVG